ncbi:MAG: Na/Pi symporter [Cyclobacteriaceae bacterium]|nr:Na/Pi symporter [Cyclobacteriaceae bacterium HetDA_MAG_MS6]
MLTKVSMSERRTLFLLLGKILAVVLIFVFAIDLIDISLRSLGKETAESFIQATTNPFIGLFMGLMITAMIQSSSTTTSIVVALVATNTISHTTAVPIIMGANVGTTITTCITSLAFIDKKKKFRRALSVGLAHNIMNLILLVVLFPLEYYLGILSGFSEAIVSLFPIEASSVMPGQTSFAPSTSIVEQLIHWINNDTLVLLGAFILLLISIKTLANYANNFFLISANRQALKTRHVGDKRKSLLVGLVLTSIVQSSSVTTSLAVPLVATGKISLKKAFPYLIGANIGTTITAFIATLFQSEAALAIATVHLLFNAIMVLLFFPFNMVRAKIVNFSKSFSTRIEENRVIGFLYILFTFFIIPFLLIYLNTD